MLNFRLQVFHSVATGLSFTKAAKELFITQPAVTKNIRELEKELRINLFERNRNKISLTKAGQVLLAYADEVKEKEKKLEFELGVLRKSFSGAIRIGASTTIGQYILPAILARFNGQNPGIEISLQNKNTADIEKDIVNKDIDLGVIEGNSRRNELKYIPFMKDEIVAIAHTSQPVARYDTLSTDELKTIPVVLREIGSGSLDVITSKLHEHGVRLKDLNVKMHLGSTESIKNFLANADCLGFVSVYAVSKEIANGEFKIIDIDGLDITRDFNFIYPQGMQDDLSETIMDFITNAVKAG